MFRQESIIVANYRLLIYNVDGGDRIMNGVLITFLTAMVCSLLILAAYSFFFGKKTHIQSAHDQELLKIHQDYISNLEALYSEMRKWRHDNGNVLLGVYGYIQNRDLDGLNDYFQNKIIPLRDRIKNSGNTFDKLNDVLIPEIKGLLMVKIMQAQEQGIKMHVFVKGTIDTIDFDMLGFTQILGILLDNAMEASLESKNPYVKFAFIREETSYLIAVVNPFGPSQPLISKIFDKDFSTKGEDRGFGLYTVRQIIDKKENAILSTYIKNEEFVQEIRLGSTQTRYASVPQKREVRSA